MQKKSFVHLHVHTDYSILNGMCRIDRLVAKTKELGMPAVAITDHGNMHGAIEFYLEAKRCDIKPIIGMEAYVAPGSRFDSETKDSAFHITLLAKNYTGYKNLMKLSSIGYLEGFHYKPRIDKEVLKKYRDGIIALSGCIKSEPARYVIIDQYDKAEKALKEYMDIFGRDNYFLEMQRHGIEEHERYNKWQVTMSKIYNLELVTTNDCRYLNPDESSAYSRLLWYKNNKKPIDQRDSRLASPEIWFKDTKSMYQRFSDIPRALENTMRIADMCNVELDFSKHYLPMYNPPDGHTREGYLKALCEEGLKRRYNKITSEIKQRLGHELDIINKMNYASYFLIVWDFIRFAREKGIPVGPGRGSSAGSLVSYLLGITNIDPLAYGLLFERFLNPSRITLPDIAIDFCDRRRDEVIDYVRDKYGKENVAQIITFGTLGAKAVIRDSARGLGFSYGEADHIAKFIPDELNITLKRAMELEPRLGSLAKEDPRIARIIEVSFGLEGLVRDASTHATGIVISEKPLTEYVPLCTGSKGEVITQYTMGPLEKIGILRMDFLGLKTLSVIKDTVDMVERSEGIRVNINEIPMDDSMTFELLNKANTTRVFLFESKDMRDRCRRIGLNNFNDMIAIVALYGPGPMHRLEDYVSRKHGRIVTKYDHPLLEPILKDTYGVMLYQEQLMQYANVIGGFSMAEADNLRRILGMKIVDKVEEQRKRFIKGAQEKRVERRLAEQIFDSMVKFAGYGSNKSHSSAYALIAYQTAYLKAHYLVQFMTALINNETDVDEKKKYVKECKRMRIRIKRK